MPKIYFVPDRDILFAIFLAFLSLLVSVGSAAIHIMYTVKWDKRAADLSEQFYFRGHKPKVG